MHISTAISLKKIINAAVIKKVDIKEMINIFFNWLVKRWLVYAINSVDLTLN